MAVELEANGGPVSSRSSAPAQNAVAVTPSDTTVQLYRSLWIGGAGNVSFIPIGGDTAVTLLAVPAGTLLPVAVSKVLAATTATAVVGLI